MKLAFDIHFPPGDSERNLPPIIMLHGMLDSRKTWKHIAPQIARNTGRKVYTVDARNHGESPWHDDITFDILAKDLDEFLSQQNISKAVLVGHSMGGRTALTLALLKPEKVEKLVVEDMTLETFRPSHKSGIIRLMEFLKLSLDYIPSGTDEMTARQSIVDLMLSMVPERRYPFVGQYDISMIPLKLENGTFSWQTNMNALNELLTTDKIKQILKGVYLGDALFLYGTASFFKVAQDPLILKHFPRVIKLGFEGATHLVHFEFTSRFIDEVSSFINGFSNMKSKY